MSLATDLEIHKQGTALLDLCADVQARIPRAFRASMGYRISDECVEILVLIGRANAARRRTLASALQRIEHLPAAEVFSAGNSYLGLVRQASHSHKERAAVCRALLKRGHAVEGMNLSKAFRRNEA